jgi:hypothetical protein
MLKENQELMKNQALLGGDPAPFLKRQLKLEKIKLEINRSLGRTVLH